MSEEGKKILVAEDEVSLLKALNVQLLNSGFEVLSATTGRAALEVMKKDKPDLVLLDIIMPEMNGFEVLQKKKSDPEIVHIPVIVLSNLGQDEDIKKAKELGARDFYIKASLSLEDLMKKVEELTQS